MTDSTRTTKTLLSCPILKWSIKTQVDAHIVSSMKEEFNVLRAKYVPVWLWYVQRFMYLQIQDMEVKIQKA